MSKRPRVGLVWVPLLVDQVPPAAAYDTLALSRVAVSRRDSPVFPLRDFNNRVKDSLIRFAALLAPRLHNPTPPRVLELAVGTGGDIQKWFRAGAGSLVGLDISPGSIEVAVGRVKGNESNVTLRVMDLLSPTLVVLAGPVQIVSCQMALHYLWPNIDRLLSEVGRVLVGGGVFIATLPSAEAIIRRSLVDGHSGNAFYSIVPGGDKTSYEFWLRDCVEHVREYLVPFQELLARARVVGLELYEHSRFAGAEGYASLAPEFREIAGLYQTLTFIKVRGKE